jgi:hypothetical protein
VCQADAAILEQLKAEKAAAEQAEAQLAQAKTRSQQKRAEISAAKAKLREMAEALDPNDERRAAFDQYMAARELREHATAEVLAHSDSLEEKRAKLDAAREHLADVSVEAEVAISPAPLLVSAPCPPPDHCRLGLGGHLNRL